MTIVEKIRQLTEQQRANFRQDANFLKIEEFYKIAVEAGIAKRPEYNLPQIDTLGVVLQTQHSE